MQETLHHNSFKSEVEYALQKKRLETIGEYSYGRFTGHERELLNAEDELSAYIDSWDGFKKASVESLCEDIIEPLPRNLSAYVIVPVAAGQETESLRATLEQYAKQDADPSTWSLLLYVNSTEGSANISSNDVDRTDEIIDDFIANNPRLSVRVVRNTYLGEAPPIGTIRGDAWDVALLDVHNNGLAHDNLIGISHDADAPWISPDYLSTMQQAARENPQADLLTCKLSWQTVGDPSSDANKILRYWEYLWGVQHHKHGKVATYDGNTAIRMSAYAAIDGFSEDDSTLEMHRLRSRLLVARGYSYQEENGNVHYIDSIRLKTDARRVYQALASHIPPDYAWTDMPFLTGEDPVRLMNTVTLANRAIASAWLHEVLERTENLHLNKLDSVTRRRLQKEGRKITGLPLAS